MRFLFVDSLTHVQELRQAVAATPPGETPPLFPSSMKELLYERALRRRGHEVAIFWRERFARNYRFSAGLTPRKAAQALGQRLPPGLNPKVILRNRQLLRAVEDFRPDALLLCAGNRVILPRTLATIKQKFNCRLLLEVGDSQISFRFPFMPRTLPLIDLVMVNDWYHGMQMRELGAQRIACLPVSAMDPDFHFPRPLDDARRAALACDVAFVGTLLPEHLYSERVNALAALREFDLGIWSVHDVPRELRPFLRGEALGEPMLDILSAATLAVNPHGQGLQYGGNLRLFEAAGVGAMQLTDDRPGIRKWFTPGENIVTYRDERDLRDKVAYYLRHDDEREEIARNARAHVIAHHRYDHRVEQLEQLLNDLPAQRGAPAGARRPAASPGGGRDSTHAHVHGAPGDGFATVVRVGSGWSSPPRARFRHETGRLKLRILFVAALTHVEQLRQAVADTPPGETPPLFPPSMMNHFYERALRRRGHDLAVFWRERPSRNYRFQAGFTPGKAAQALGQRLPPRLHSQVHQRNRQLLRRAAEFKPDVLWMTNGNRNILPQTLATIKREHDCRLIFANDDSPLLFDYPLDHRAMPLLDLVLVNDYYHGILLRELGARRVVCLPLSAVHPDFHRPRRLDERQRKALACDVAFVGTLLPEHLYGERASALAALREFDPGIWSVHDAPRELRPFLRGEALGELMLDILSAAKVAVNPHGQVMQYGGNMRLFEAAGVGTLQITDDRPGIRKWFTPGENIVTFRDERDLRDKVAYYLARDDEREELARNAREHVLAHHRYDQRVEQIERLLAAT